MMKKIYKKNKNTWDFLEDSTNFSDVRNRRLGYDFVEILPPEISLQIFCQLDLKSLCNAAVTCQAWNHIIENCDQLWRNHCMTVRTICQKEIDGDRGVGYSWKVTLVRNYRKGYVKKQWLSGCYSNILSSTELPAKSMYPLDAETWGEILEAELER
ncbi:F-box only protein 48 [Acipenser ruthenus]|nr:F-box only protein 48 [Acipenser ruthenus]XP_033860090.1 F-box only protein 48 [Acipenser ruthenus]